MASASVGAAMARCWQESNEGRGGARKQLRLLPSLAHPLLVSKDSLDRVQWERSPAWRANWRSGGEQSEGGWELWAIFAALGSEGSASPLRGD